MPTPELSNSGVPLAAADELAVIYERAAEQLRQWVLHPPGGTSSGQAFRQARSAMLLHQIDTLVAQMGHASSLWIGKNLPQVFRDGIARADAQAKAVGVKPKDSPVQGSFGLIDKRTVEIFAKDIYNDLNNAGKSMGERAKAVLRKTAQRDLTESQIDRILAGGVITGQPVQTIHKLRDELTAINGGTVRIIDKNGDPINYSAGYYASLVVRTKTREATVKARHSRLQDLGLDLVSIVGLVSKNFCTAFLGQVFSLSGKSDKYPAIPSGDGYPAPPFHPNCSKSTRPYVEALASDKEQDMAEGLDDADKLLKCEPSEAQKRFQDLQLHQQVKAHYASTAKKLFGKVDGD
jgi:hypothetical protein